MDDPFASAPEPTPAPQPVQEEPKGDPWAEPQKSVGTVNVDVKPNLLPLDDGKVVLTFKGGAGFDSPWIVIHATDLDDALDHVTAQGSKLMSLMERVQRAGQHFAGQGSSAGGSPQRPLQNGQPAGSVEAPSWAPPKPYDDAVYKTGVSKKNGKVWHAWMPPTKEDSRQAKFFDPR